MKTTLNILGLIWASPFTLLALIPLAFARLFGHVPKAERKDWTLRFKFPKDSPLWKFYDTRDLTPFDGEPGKGITGTTLGAVIFGRVEAFERESFVKHEMQHVHQFKTLGVFMLPLWALSCICALAYGLHPYYENHCEIAARRAAKR